MIDTHAHIYDDAFDTDRVDVVRRAIEAGVKRIILPNVDSGSLEAMKRMEAEFPGYCYAAIGLHPTSVKENFEEELALVRMELEQREYIAIGEIGVDLYWDKTYYKEQLKAFTQQIDWALEYDLPIIIHTRESLNETLAALHPYKDRGLTGVFHSFTGTLADAEKILGFGGFKLGINGVVTFKNSMLRNFLSELPLENIVTETDSPYLTPVPYRGKRNESSYIQYVVDELAGIYQLSREEVVRVTTDNANEIFKKADKNNKML